MNNTRPLIIAHRGASYYAPENTIPAVKLAWQQDTDALEIDVHKTGDDHLVVIHDPDTLRTTGIKKVIKDEDLNTIQKLDAGKWKDPKWEGVYIPELEEVLKTVPSDKKIFIEVKSPDCIDLIDKIIQKSRLSHRQLVIMDFNINTVIEAKNTFTQCEILWLYEFIPPLKEIDAKNTFDTIITKALSVKANGINLECNSFINRSLITKVHELKMKFYTWTVNDIINAQKLRKWDIDGITTDRPGFLKENLNKQNG